MNVMIIGSESFIGTHLIEHLKNQNYNVVAMESFELIDNTDDDEHDNVHSYETIGFKKIKDAINRDRPQWIFSLPAQSSVKFAWENPVATVNMNINTMLYLLDVVKQLDYKPHVLIVGSADEYGFVPYNNMPIKESTPTNPENIFAATKVCQEMLAQIYHEAYKMNVVIARVFNEIGPKQSDEFVIANFVKQIAMMEVKKNINTLHVGNLNIERDFIDVRDMVKALEVLIKKGKFGNVYNVGTGKAITILKIVDILKTLSDIDFDIKVEQSRLRHIDIAKLEADVTKIYADTGWKSEISIEKTVKDMLQYWRNILKEKDNICE